MASKALISKTSRKSPGPANSVAPTGDKGVRVSPGKGGAGRIGPDHCTSKRAAPNVRQSY